MNTTTTITRCTCDAPVVDDTCDECGERHCPLYDCEAGTHLERRLARAERPRGDPNTPCARCGHALAQHTGRDGRGHCRVGRRRLVVELGLVEAAEPQCRCPRFRVRPPQSAWPAELGLNGWHGLTWQRVEVVGETPTRYRIRAIQRTRLAGPRYLEPGETALVPRHAIRRVHG